MITSNSNKYPQILARKEFIHMIKVDLSGASSFFKGNGPDYAAVAEAHRTLAEGTGKGNDFIGWLTLPQTIAAGELKQIVACAKKIRARSQALLVVGIGGSYLGARAAVDLLRPTMKEGDVDIIFVGNGLSPDAMMDTLHRLGDKDFDICVISKSGTTLEPALAFRMYKGLLVSKYGAAEAGKRITAVTDAHRGVLHDMAVKEGWEMFVVPDDVGGRFSVLSAVGLLPMAVAGIDVEKVIACAIDEFKAMDLRSPENPAWQYAAARQHLYRNGKSIEILASYEPSFRFFAEWWKQLYGESEGKDGIGSYPASVEFTADLHSMGQYIQDGPRFLYETVVMFEEDINHFEVPHEVGDPDGLNYLAGRQLGDIMRTAAAAVKQAHIDGGVPNITISVPKRDEAGFAALVVFFELACGLSGYVSGVNPFDQPGVEAYKKNMFRMLGKPGAK